MKPRYFWLWPRHLKGNGLILLERKDESRELNRMVRVKLTLAPVKRRKRAARKTA